MRTEPQTALQPRKRGQCPKQALSQNRNSEEERDTPLYKPGPCREGRALTWFLFFSTYIFLIALIVCLCVCLIYHLEFIFIKEEKQ